MQQNHAWSLNRALMLLLTGGLLLLLVDTRYEHRSVLNDEAAAWIPLLFSVIGVIVALIAVLLWKPIWRPVLTTVFAISLLVGLGGVYFHTDGKPERVLRVFFPGSAPEHHSKDHEASAGSLYRLAHSDVSTVSDDSEEDDDEPPVLAPLAFVGIGLMGLAGTSRRLRAEQPD